MLEYIEKTSRGGLPSFLISLQGRMHGKPDTYRDLQGRS